MRRAVSACTSPEVFFGKTANLDASVPATSSAADPLGMAMAALDIRGAVGGGESAVV